jgi:hypothetical protein
VRDYSEKRGGRESIERKPVAKNLPRRESGGLLKLLGLVLLIGCSFGAGAFSGWKLKGARVAATAAVVQAPRKQEAAPAASAAQEPKPEAPLTFYKTLPAGGKGVIGTGLNLKKPEPAQSTQREVPAAAAPGAPEPTAAPAAAPAVPVPAPAAAPTAAPAKAESSSRFVVQVASYRDKHEATEAQTKLSGKGVAAYLVETKVADKLWYRLRVGRHLTRSEAGELAAKSGKGAIVLPE